MTPEEWWKNFALGIELDISGTFIYNGIKAFHELKNLNYPVDIFEVLYNLSVGIERLLKVTIILIEYHYFSDIKKLEESLITHNTLDLINRIKSRRPLKVAKIHLEFLSILSRFYKSYRYGRYQLACVPEIAEEQRMLIDFFEKHLKISCSGSNTDQNRRFLGKLVKTICNEIFQVACQRAHELNICTTEIRSNSKAMKVFYGKSLDFTDETLMKKELLLFLMNSRFKSDRIDFLNSIAPLKLDSSMELAYIQALLDDLNLPYVEDEIYDAYEKVRNVRDRRNALGFVDRSGLSFDEEDD